MGIKRKQRLEQERKEKKRRMIVTTAVLVGVVAIIGIFLVALKSTALDVVKLTPDQNGYLRISKDSLQDSLNYIDYGGTEELIVWKDTAGEMRTAFDTCEECYAGGNVNFTLSGEIITCNLCGTTQPVSVLGTEGWGGCKPVSVTPEMREDTDTELVISPEVLAYAEDMFSHWDGNDYSVSFETYGTDEAHTH